ncbi:HD-GYP domain-containing protein [Treponema pectinovorum]|uniref:HD-GYP domain-containing protein n=1 Tax=Treponema pectinovorum TaxID=164 RepID=UPI0011CC1120|nr:HD domain-containing phosphohydrolase [Treponema pectinovorum]
MNSFSVASLQDNSFFSQDLVLDNQFILLNSSCPFTNSLRKALLEWDFKLVYSEGSQGIQATSAPVSTDFENVDIDNVGPQEKENKTEEMGSSVKKVIEKAHSALANNEKSRMAVVQTIYNEYMNYITAVYTKYATHKTLNYEDLCETVKELCVFIKENRRYVLRISPTQDKISKNYLISHSMRSTVIAIVIGLQLSMPLSKLVDLGITCILHEIGQIRLPPQLYMTDRILSPAEKAKLATHAVLGFNIAKENNFPGQIQMGILEHHERENGTGYPRKLSGNQIDIFAKIIGVACSFEAITAPRHFKQARSSYDAMIEILKNEGKQFDDTVIKALLYSLSLFPIGAYVYLSNGKIGQVTDVNPNSPGNPLVSILGESDSFGRTLTVQSDNGTNKIVRVLNKKESADILQQFNLSK